MTTLPLRLGLTLWSHSAWQPFFYGKGTQSSDRLAKYSEVFHTVEGNTTFYASPSASTVRNWRDATPDEFRFTFKLPKFITHEQQLRGCQQALHDFLTLMAPLHEKIGQWTLQLPAQFSPNEFATLQQFCRLFPAELPLGIEVRHPAFFRKGPEEIALNQWLMAEQYDRIIMDSRPVFSVPPTNDILVEAQKKKPQVPVHALATANHPMIRFIGLPTVDDNLTFFQPWLKKLPQWISEGKHPYLMIHTADNHYAPQLAQSLYQQLADIVTLPPLASFPATQGQHQISMF